VQVDLTSPGQEGQREFMRKKAKVRPGQSVALPPQIFNTGRYCGDYQDFDDANEACRLSEFLGVELKESVNQVAGSWKGREREKAFVELALEKSHKLEANSYQELEKLPEFQKEEDLVEEGVECLSARPPEHISPPEQSVNLEEEAAERESSDREGVMAKEPEEVIVHILEVFPNLPVSPIQKLEAATVPDTSVDQLTQQIPIVEPSPPLGVDVTAFQKSWKEVRKQRQTETVKKYKEKLQNEADFLHRSEDRGPVFNRVTLLLSLNTLFK